MADDVKRVLGTGAKGDIKNPGLRHDLTEATADEVVEKVETGQVSPDEALASEKGRDKPRKTVIEKLEEGDTDG